MRIAVAAIAVSALGALAFQDPHAAALTFTFIAAALATLAVFDMVRP